MVKTGTTGALKNHATQLLVVTLAALVLSACSTYPKSFSNESPEGRFGDYRTFAFAENPGTDENKEVRSLLTQYLMSEIRGQMSGRGYVENSDTPDLTFNFELVTKEKIRSTPSGTVGGYYGYGRNPYYGGYGGYGSYGYSERIIQFTEGSLYVTLIDNETRNVVWEGISVTRIDDSVLEDVNANIRLAVAELFGLFPHYAPGAIRPTAGDGQTAAARY